MSDLDLKEDKSRKSCLSLVVDNVGLELQRQTKPKREGRERHKALALAKMVGLQLDTI